MSTNTMIALPDGGTVPAYVIRPEGTPRGAIVIVQEVFGVEGGIMRKTEGWARKGYLAVAPDVFWRQEPGAELDADIPEQFQHAIKLMMGHDFDKGTEDLMAVIAWARAESGGKVGLVGFCMGGKIAWLAATQTDIDASVGYYGVGIDQMLGAAAGIAKPLLLHVPTADGFVPPEAQAAIHAGLDGNPLVTIHDYPGLDHGFAAELGMRRNEDAAQLADGRTAEFLAAHVG